jgi:hypothetical protein
MLIWRPFVKGIFRTLLFWSLILGACTTGVSFPQTVPPLTTEASPALPTTGVPSNPQECGYQWAYKDLPELSSSFHQSILVLHPEAQASAFAFGENCVHSDGSADFIAMETDFNVHLPVAELTDYGSFGNWISQVIGIVEQLPSNLLLGPQPGVLEFKFIKSEAEFLYARVPIQQYRETAGGKNRGRIVPNVLHRAVTEKYVGPIARHIPELAGFKPALPISLTNCHPYHILRLVNTKHS